MTGKRWLGVVLVLAMLAAQGCEKPPPPPAYKPREAPESAQTVSPAATRPQMTTSGLGDPHAGMTGFVHPPMSQPVQDGAALQLDPPKEWRAKAARPMTSKVFAVPKVEGDPEDADLAISYLTSQVSLQMNVTRWCSQFGVDAGACEQAARKTTLDGTKYPTTVVEIDGTYQPGSMMGPASSPKPDYRMLAAEIRTPDRAWYVKLVGPKKTVERWRDAFTQFVKEAK